MCEFSLVCLLKKINGEETQVASIDVEFAGQFSCNGFINELWKIPPF